MKLELRPVQSSGTLPGIHRVLTGRQNICALITQHPKANAWRYVLAEELTTKSIGLDAKPGAFRLTKEKKDGPVTLVVKHSPSRLSLLLDIPKESEAEYSLKIGDREFVVPAPRSKEN